MMNQMANRWKAMLTWVIVVLMLAMALPAQGIAATDNFFLNESQERIYTGDVTGAIQEQYLYQDSGSTTEVETPVGGWGGAPPYLTKRWADGHDWFSYRIPVDASTEAPLYLSMVTKGEVKLTVAGNVILDTGNSGEGDYTAREFKLTDPGDWADGYVEVKFEDADPSDGWGPNVYWLELGPSSRWQDRLRHIHWDTTDLVWYVGYPDGYASEFQGNVTNFTVGDDIATLKQDGTIYLNWDQHVDPTKTYYLLVGIIGRHNGIFNKANGTDFIDVGNDGTYEIAEATGGEKIYDVDITSQVQATGNVVKVSVPDGARYDFFSVIEVSPTPVTDMSELRVSFGGNEQADNFSKIINYTMLHTLDFMNYENSGLIDASPLNGMFWNSYWVADIGPGVTELLKWGYIDRVREVLDYSQADATGHYEDDIAAGNLIFNSMANLMRTDNFSAATQAAYWDRLKDGMNRLVEYIDDNPYDLVFGTNWETSSNSLGIYASSTSYVALKNAADIADQLNHTTERDLWNLYADKLYDGIMTHLRWQQDGHYSGQPMRQWTWKYGITRDGNNPDAPHAAWHAIGSVKDGYLGLKEDLPQWRAISDYTLDTHRETFWDHWTVYGNNKGFGTDYGVLSERGGWPLNSLLEADRMADAKKNLEHVAFNSTDLNFLPYGPNASNHWDNAGDYQEYSPWDIIRETDPEDRGSSSIVGNGAGNEDLNLVEYMLFLKNARIMAGVDDALYGDNNLVIIPRLPWGWDRVHVNSWPVTYRNGSQYAQTEVSYQMVVAPEQATFNMSSEEAIDDVQIRMGPFDPTASVVEVTVDGISAPYTSEVRGDAMWVWVTEDIDSSEKQIVASVDVPRIAYEYDFAGGLTGYTPHGGAWSAADGKAAVTANAGDAWNIANDTVDDHVISADVTLHSGNAVGVSLRTNDDGTEGYDLIIDRVDERIKLVRRPYTVLASTPLNVNLERTYQLQLAAYGARLEGSLNGVKVLDATDHEYSSGKHGLFAFKSTADYDNVLVKAIDHDDFAGPLDSEWTWEAPLAGPTYSLQDDKFVLDIPDTGIYDNWDFIDEAPKLVRTNIGSGDFTIETKLNLAQYEPNTNFHTGLFVRFGTNNYYIWGNLRGHALEFVRSGHAQLGYVADYDDPTVSLRLRKLGNGYFVDYKANDNAPWVNVSSDYYEGQPEAVGVMAKTWEALEQSIEFEYFTLHQ